MCENPNNSFLLQGLAITFVSDETDAKILNEVQDRFEVDITELPDEIGKGSLAWVKVGLCQVNLSFDFEN